MKPSLLLCDFAISENWDFLNALRRGGVWEARGCACSRKSRWESAKTMIKFFAFPLKMLRRRRNYGVVVGWQQFFGLNYAFWSRLLKVKKVNPLYVMTFIYKPKGGLLGRLYHHYMRYIVTSPYIDRIICFSSSECDMYREIFGIDKFTYVPLGIESGGSQVNELPSSVARRIFSTGRSNRDYDFLIEALADTDYDLHIAGGTYQYTRGPLPPNVTLLQDCYGTDMLREMAQAEAVVIPLADRTISSGQLVVLQAQRLRRPVIATRSSGITDYIDDGTSGLLIDNTTNSLRYALNILRDPERAKEIALNGRASFDATHTHAAMAANILSLIHSIDNGNS